MLDGGEEYSEAIKNEINKGRTFEQILNEIPTTDASEQEMDAYFDAGYYHGVDGNEYMDASLTKVIIISLITLLLVAFIIASPFILYRFNLSLVFLIPGLIPIGFLLSIFGKIQNRVINQYSTKRGSKIIYKYLLEDGYREKFDRQQNSKILQFLRGILIFIFTPIDWVCDLLVDISIRLFPTKKY